MLGPIHAFTMQTVTPKEAEERGLKTSQEEARRDQSSPSLVTLK